MKVNILRCETMKLKKQREREKSIISNARSAL